jgi:hypothetical protein
VKALDSRILEHIHALESATLSPDHSLVFWSSPPLGVIKLNVDAALTPSKASIAVVARNSEGSLSKHGPKISIRLIPSLQRPMPLFGPLNLLLQKDLIRLSLKVMRKAVLMT